MDIATTFIVTRAIERILIVAIGGASIWMGWQLFLRLQTQADQQASFSFKDISVQLQKVGPGIFFALFGATLLSVTFYNLPSLNSPLPTDRQTAVSTAGPSPTSIRMLGSGNTRELERVIVALNLAITAAGANDIREVPQLYITNLRAGEGALAIVRIELLNTRFGKEAVDLWLQHRDEYRRGVRTMAPNVLENVKRVDELVSKLDYGA